jgi:hypothetical protein
MRRVDFDKPVRVSWLRDLAPVEAYIWSSKAADEAFSKGVFKIRCRPRVTQHGGATSIHILLITARPYEGDVRYRALSRPLVELIEKQLLPAQVTALRPPTFDTLRAHLRERPAYYHIVHFDGHGGYGLAEVGSLVHLYSRKS